MTLSVVNEHLLDRCALLAHGFELHKRRLDNIDEAIAAEKKRRDNIHADDWRERLGPACERVLDRGLWGRLRWLFTGR